MTKKHWKTWIGASFVLLALAACGAETNTPVGTLIVTANGEDFVRDGFVSEDGWQIDFETVQVNVQGPTAYQVVEQALSTDLRHGGHPHGDIPDGAAHVALMGEYMLSLKQPTFELGRIEDAPIGNYNRLNFDVLPTTEESMGMVPEALGASIRLVGQAQKEGQTIQFELRFTEEMHYESCGPNEDAGVLAEGGEAEAQMTFHFDHVFGDFDEGEANPTDEETVNYMAIGFGPFAALAEDDSLNMDQAQLQAGMDAATFTQLIEAVKTLGHSGEGHCHLAVEE